MADKPSKKRERTEESKADGGDEGLRRRARKRARKASKLVEESIIPEYKLSEEEEALVKRLEEWKDTIRTQSDHIRHFVFAQKAARLEERFVAFSSKFTLAVSDAPTPDMAVAKVTEISEELRGWVAELRQEVVEVMENVNTVRLAFKFTVPSASDQQTFQEGVKIDVLKELSGIGRYCGFTVQGMESCTLNRAALRELAGKRGWSEDYVLALGRLDDSLKSYVRQWLRDFKTLHMLIDDLIGKNLKISTRTKGKGRSGATSSINPLGSSRHARSTRLSTFI